MRKWHFGAAFLAGLCAGSAAWANPSVYPTGVTRYDPAAAYNCDLLFTAADHKTYLIDMNGAVLHHWDAQGFPAKMIDPAQIGGSKGVVGLQLSSILADQSAEKGSSGTGLVPGMPSLSRVQSIGLVDWAGMTLWQWGDQAPGGAARQHHDWNRLPNGHTLILANMIHILPGFGNRPMLDDVVYEIGASGQIVWSWIASEHLHEFGFTRAQLELIRHESDADYLHVNNMKVLGPNHWAEGGDSRFASDNIIISSRNANFTVIISHKTGRIVWRLGPNYPAREEHKPVVTPRPIDQISGQHDAQMIPEGLPAAGNILMFDNQGEAGYPPAVFELTGGSRVLEIDPEKNQIVWEYTGRSSGEPDWTFYSSFISSVQRLPNGNTLINEGVNGRFFQVTRHGDIVWEYVSPFTGIFQTPLASQQKLAMSNWVYRIQAVPYEWVPDGSHSQIPVNAPDLAAFHVPAGK